MSMSRKEELERIARDYHLNEEVPDKFIETICQEYCCEWLGTLMTPGDRVVELGYGDGVTLNRLAPIASHYTIVEGARTLAELVRGEHPDVEVVNELFEAYVPSEGFDLVLALHVFEHVDNPIELGRHLRSWLKPEGEIVVVVPNKASLHRQLAVLMGLSEALDTLSPRDHMVGHQRVYDLAGLERDLRESGFEPFAHKGFFIKTLPNVMMLDYSPELLRALNDLAEQLPSEAAANLAVRARLRD